MPYKIRKLPNQNKFKVYSKSGAHSKKGLSKAVAQKQLTALNLAELRKKGKIPPRK